MQHKVLVAYASRHGSTEGIGQRIAATLQVKDVDATAVPIGDIKEVDGYDGYVVGSAVYALHWLRWSWELRPSPSGLPPAASGVAVQQRTVDGRVRRPEGGCSARTSRILASRHRGTWPRDLCRGLARGRQANRGDGEGHVPLPDGAQGAARKQYTRDWAAIDAFAERIAGEVELALRPGDLTRNSRRERPDSRRRRGHRCPSQVADQIRPEPPRRVAAPQPLAGPTLEKLERRAASGRHVGHPTIETEPREGRHRGGGDTTTLCRFSACVASFLATASVPAA